MIRSVILATSLALASVTACFAQTAAEKEACKSDALKYCSADVGKPEQMRACLEQHKSELSQACLAVVEAHGG